LLTLFAQAAWSQAPRTVKIIVPYTPASGPDIPQATSTGVTLDL
jgi:hypothetical protein